MEINLICDEISKRHLYIDKIMKLDESQRNFIISMFDRLLVEISGVNNNGYNYLVISLIYNTLVDNDYLVTRREKNLNTLID